MKVDCDYILTGKQERTYDQSLIGALEPFEKDKIEQITHILMEIYALL